MEKQRMKDIFQNLNIDRDDIRHLNKKLIRDSETRIPLLKNKYFGPKRRVCRQLTFDSAPHDLLEETNPGCSQQRTLPSGEIFSQGCSAFYFAQKLADNDNILPEIEYEDSFLQTRSTKNEKNNNEFFLQTNSNSTAKDISINENIQENSLRSPAVKILSNVLLPTRFIHTEKNAPSVQEHSSCITVTSTAEKMPPKNVLEDDHLQVPAVITSQDAPLITECQEKVSPAPIASTLESKASLMCKIDLSRMSTIMKNKLTTTLSQDQPIVEIDKPLPLDLNADSKDILSSGNDSKDFPSKNSDYTSKSPQRSTRKFLRPNKRRYIISPMNSNESDPELSDSDPTYCTELEEMGKRPPPLLLRSRSRNLSSSSSCSVTSSKGQERSTTPKRKTRKRKHNPESWKFNVAKRLRNTGQAYITVKNDKKINARSVKQPCNEKCRLKCSEKISGEERQTYINTFWGLNNVNLQRAYVKSCMLEIKPKYKYSQTENPRKPNYAFYFKQADKNERVCKTFFMNTLDITDRMIRTIKKKTDEQNFLTEDKRGKHNNHKKIDSILVTDIKQFIESIPRIESHYTRATSSCEYICPGKTMTDLYNDFVEQQQKNGRISGKYSNFYEIFKDTGIKFHQPKKDHCDLCRDYNLTKNPDLKEDYDKHQEEKELSRKEKRKDRYAICENNVCAVYDLEAILQAPFGKSSSFYYKTKMNCYNFTIAELAKKSPSEEESNKAYTDVYNYFWDETQGQKGATEIATCVLDFLKMINERSTSKSVKVTLYSDNCCGQNKNKFIATLYMYALAQFKNINCIIHKYLIKGHTQNENDNAHSLIEKEIQKFIKGDTIYTPLQYIPLIKSAKKTGKKFQVKTLAFEDFIDIKNLQAQWGSNFTKDTNRNPLTWNHIKILKFQKEDHFKFYFKTSYKDKEYREIDVRAGLRKSLPVVRDIVLEKAYNKRFELKENQKKDLRSLIDKKVIPVYYSSYYHDVI